ncbi:MAG: type IV pilus modification PilV family protein [Phycisphaerales bacterium]
MTSSGTNNRARGFTLLEVLISVVVLAFGLLGVVAVFPAVIDLQRRAQDAVIGGASAASAEAVLRATLFDSTSLDWAVEFESENLPRQERFPVRSILTDDLYLCTDGAISNAETLRVDYLWETDWSWNRLNGGGLASALVEDGVLVLGSARSTVPGWTTLPSPNEVPLNGFLPPVEFTLADRLLPDAASGAPPRYVWDMVVRRVDNGLGAPRNDSYVARDVPISRVRDLPVEIAIFVRPIDRGIRVPVGLTLREVLSGFRIDGNGQVVELDENQRSFPVSVKADLVTPRPGVRLDAAEAPLYSAPIAMRVLQPRRPVFPGQPADATTTSLLRLDRLIPEDDGRTDGDRTQRAAAMRQALAQVGQLFVDNLGVVHRVTRVTDDGVIEVDPPISDPGSTRGRVQQIVFTPQVPADIRVIRTR